MQLIIKLFISCIMLLSSFVTADTTITINGVEGSAERGRLAFGSCRTCHYPEQSLGHNNGPSLWSIIGQEAGSQSGFEYSEVFQQANFVWTPELMNVWIESPRQFLPGNMMMSVPVKNPQQRADIIAYLLKYKEAGKQRTP
jgi:cytochrome c